MLIVQALDDSPEYDVKRGDQFSFYIVDAHHHMGKEKSHRNTPSGAYDFYTQLWFEIQKMTTEMMDQDLLCYRPITIKASPFAERLFSTNDAWSSLNHGWLVDRTIVFPYSDDYAHAGAPEDPSFMISNDRIAGWTTRAPNSARLIGFARVDPNDAKRGPADLAVRELDRAITRLGLRGLKLHPLSQLFIDELTDAPTKSVLSHADELGVPVIFDTRSISTVMKIAELVRSVKTSSSSKRSHLVGADIILAHCGMCPDNPHLYEVLNEPYIYGETSTIHDRDIPVLFKMAYELLDTNNIPWSSKLLFGTDYTFLSVQAAQLIMYLLSRDFPGGPADIGRILGGNALSIIQRPMRTASGSTKTPTQIVFHDVDGHIQGELENVITQYIGSGAWELLSVDMMLPPRGTWHCSPFNNENACGVSLSSYLLTVRTKQTNDEFHIWVRRQPGRNLSCSVLGTRCSPSITSTELCAQSIDYTLEKILNEHSRVVQPKESAKKVFRDIVQ